MPRRTTVTGTSGNPNNAVSPIKRGSRTSTGGMVTNNTSVPNVEFTRKELTRVLHLYDLIRDCISGSHTVKLAGDKYLPRPNPSDTSDSNIARYGQYVQRAVFYNVTRRTLYALVGQIFMRDPQVELPASMEAMKQDANGENVTLEQVAMTAALSTMAYGRSGLHADFPSLENGLTMADLETDDYRPTVNAYQARDIINWRVAMRGARKVYTLIVIREDHHVHDDGFETKTELQYKVLRLLPLEDVALLGAMYPTEADDLNVTAVSGKTDVYQIEIWRKLADSGFGIAETYFPKDSTGNYLNEIPFIFVGAEKNDDAVDHPPLADLAEINIAHYRNSADYEETSFITGQPTPFVSGVTEEWNTNVLKGTIQLGSRGVIPLPVGGTAGLLQAEANSVPYEAMQSKERQMVALGAKLIEQRQVQRTATEAQMEGTADTSILANIAQNVSAAMQWIVQKCCLFTGDPIDSVSFILNTEFDLLRMDPADRQQLLLEWQGGAIAFEEMRANLKRGGIATLDDKEAQTAIAADEKLRQDAALQTQKILNTKPVGTQAAAPGGSPAASPQPAK